MLLLSLLRELRSLSAFSPFAAKAFAFLEAPESLRSEPELLPWEEEPEPLRLPDREDRGLVLRDRLSFTM